jgi:hypothetical protein
MSKRVLILMLVSLAGIGGTGSVVAQSASASATTCIQVSGHGSSVCTYVDGSGTYVAHVQSQYFKSPADGIAICNSSAFFYYVPPGGGAYSYGYQSRGGCQYGAAYFQQNVNRSFPVGTLMCAKFMVNYGVEVGEKCVGLS